MSDRFHISVILSTYNRCAILPFALESVLRQEPGVAPFEVIVVDNNSGDQTRAVVESFIDRGYPNLRYVFEGRQGVSYARNAGIEMARASIIAFFDDDVCVSPTWIATIKRAFEEYRAADCVGGSVLPRWELAPPSWLTREHWAPLALQDYGDRPIAVNRNNPLCLLSANFAFRREVFDRIGKFEPELQRVREGIGSMEDLELLTRFWRAGGNALYLPSLTVTANVPAERLTKRYHRKWHTGHGHFYAMLRAEEMERSRAGRLFDVPAHLYRQAMKDALRWLKHQLPGRSDDAFTFETRLRFFAGFFRKRRADFLARTTEAPR
jgi:glycosyltransferase involved in cell wall biosynthesis